MCSLLNELENWGCNTQKALFNVMGDRDFYRDLLKRFLKDPSVDHLRQAVRDGDLPTAIQASHEIKGTTATLGLDPLHQEISNFLDMIRDGNVNQDQLRMKYKPVEKQLTICYGILGNM